MTTIVDNPVQYKVLPDSGVIVMARIRGNDAANITQASLTGATVKITDLESGTVLLAATSLTIASVVFDTLQTDDKWDVDAIGYNFAYTVADTVIASGGTTVVIDVTFDPVSGQDFGVVWKLEVLPRYN